MSAPVPLDAELLRRLPLPDLGAGGDKEKRGRVLVVGGSPETPGAVRLAGEAALRAGAGKLQVATHADVARRLAVHLPEALVTALPDDPAQAAEALRDRVERSDAVLIGPGLTEGDAATALTRALLVAAPRTAFVLDAAALAGLLDAEEALGGCLSPPVATPHAGEMATLLGCSRDEVEADPLEVAKASATRLGAVVALKGAVTYVAAPDGQAWAHTAGDIGLGTSGSGDVLAGAVAGLRARGADPVTATLWGVWAHGQAGVRLGERCGGIGYLARELPGEIPHVLNAGGR